MFWIIVFALVVAYLVLKALGIVASFVAPFVAAVFDTSALVAERGTTALKPMSDAEWRELGSIL